MFRTLSLMTAAAVIAVASPALAEPATLGSLSVDAPWSRASAGAARAGAAFMTITNSGAEADRLVSAAADATAARVELHTHTNDNGVMRMRQVPAIDLPAGETVTLQPGGLHVMMMGLTAPLAEGASFPVTLTFEKAGSLTVQVPVQAAGSMGGAMGGGHGAMPLHKSN